jgi:pyrimidine operon attenuation protein/uracil phosphoribosyltransferase
MNAGRLHEVLLALAEALHGARKGREGCVLVGIQRRGALLAEELGRISAREYGVEIPVGSLDITLYRDDWTTGALTPKIGRTLIPFGVEGKTLILVDDVLYTGRTVRAALEALSDFGRPGRVELLVLVDRGHRELPIRPDYVGITLDTAKHDRVDVLVASLDGEDGVRLTYGGDGDGCRCVPAKALP